MNVTEAQKIRHLLIRLDPGDELHASLSRALDEAQAESAFITGVGALEAAEIALYDQATKSYGRARRIEGGCEVVSLSGNAALLDGAPTVRLSAVLARETELGLETFAGQLVWARAFSLELDVTAFDDVRLHRVADERTGLPALAARPVVVEASATAHPAPAAPAAPTAPVHRPPVVTSAPEPHVVAAPSPPPAPAHHHVSAIPLPAPASPPLGDGPVVPAHRPMRARDEPETYPELGDSVNHFHFGDCTVVGSDGDRIKLRQDGKDGRVREVALAMLKVGAPTTTADGRRHFMLLRKN
jgi:predicted DNA-binding protein with PD1-like motif